jgi:hypothetical protein
VSSKTLQFLNFRVDGCRIALKECTPNSFVLQSVIYHSTMVDGRGMLEDWERRIMGLSFGLGE